MLTDVDKENPKKPIEYSCNFCDFISCNKKDYDRHVRTDKHKMLTDVDTKNLKKPQTYLCECGKIYKYRQSLSVHRKKCQQESETNTTQNSTQISNQIVEKKEEKCEGETNYKELIMILVNENKEMRKTISELIPKVGNNNTINTINNNQKFNVNVFLNEKCKDAISIDDFIKQIEISVKDLLLTKDKGLIEGVSNIFIENMNKLSLYERPMHCTDMKREVLYIKKDDWTKDSNKSIIKGALKEVASKQAKSVVKWKAENPDFMDIDKKKDDFVRIVKATTDDINEDKIIKTICKDIHLSESSITTL